MGRILSIDYGTKRMGLAISDETNTISQPLPYLLNTNRKQILALVAKQAVQLVLLGWPLNLKGQKSPATKQVEEFAEWLRTGANVEIRLIEERFTTQEVLSELRSQGQQTSKHRDSIDSLVAQKMLMRYLEKTKYVKSHSS